MDGRRPRGPTEGTEVRPSSAPARRPDCQHGCLCHSVAAGLRQAAQPLCALAVTCCGEDLSTGHKRVLVSSCPQPRPRCEVILTVHSPPSVYLFARVAASHTAFLSSSSRGVLPWGGCPCPLLTPSPPDGIAGGRNDHSTAGSCHTSHLSERQGHAAAKGQSRTSLACPAD